MKQAHQCQHTPRKLYHGIWLLLAFLSSSLHSQTKQEKHGIEACLVIITVMKSLNPDPPSTGLGTRPPFNTNETSCTKEIAPQNNSFHTMNGCICRHLGTRHKFLQQRQFTNYCVASTQNVPRKLYHNSMSMHYVMICFVGMYKYSSFLAPQNSSFNSMNGCMRRHLGTKLLLQQRR